MNDDSAHNDSGGVKTSIGHVTIEAGKFNNMPPLDALPLIATRDFVLFPEVTFPISLVRDETLATARRAVEEHMPVGIVCQIEPTEAHPTTIAQLHKYGVLGAVLQILDLPDGSQTAIVRGLGKFKITGEAAGADADGRLRAAVKMMKETSPRSNDLEFTLLVKEIKDTIVALSGGIDEVPPDLKFNIENSNNPEELLNLIATHVPLPTDFKIRMLAQSRLKERAYMMLPELSKNRRYVDIMQEIKQRTKARIDAGQRNAFLGQQLEAIKEELYGDTDDATELRTKARSVALSEDARKTFEREVAKLERMAPQSPDYSVQLGYLETLISLPWGVADPVAVDFAAAEKTLEESHFGLAEVKERILEQIAVLLNNPAAKAPTLCLVGAPGVGKTSLGEAIAKAMGRKYRHVALGGLHDEAEIRGHRRTYIGALPGRVMDAVRKAGTSNPVILLDEVDKLGRDFKGDPSSALLEVLDPEQNCRFHDNYVDVDFDLSGVLFIATANTLETVPAPLIDRMEVIELPGYATEEKIEIARRHLIPAVAEELGTPEGTFAPDADTLTAIIDGYTRESGVRQLRSRIAKIARKSILQQMRRQSSDNQCVTPINATTLTDYLGAPRYIRGADDAGDFAGVATGLAWTAAGGETLTVEASLSPAKQFALELTGNLGTVMKESATVAAQWVKAHAEALGIAPETFDGHTLSIHAPEGAVPKDGPSAGVTLVTAIVSACKGVKTRGNVAMTGEVTLRGKVLPVGGIREKLLAARRAGMTDVLLPSGNSKDVSEINPDYLERLTIRYVDTVAEVLEFALTDEPGSK